MRKPPTRHLQRLEVGYLGGSSEGFLRQSESNEWALEGDSL